MSISPKKNNFNQTLQFEIFESSNFFAISPLENNELIQSRSSLIQWRHNIYEYQKTVIEKIQNQLPQKSLFKIEDNLDLIKINPFLLKSFSINFWRSKKSVDKGPAMYFVIDTQKTSK